MPRVMMFEMSELDLLCKMKCFFSSNPTLFGTLILAKRYACEFVRVNQIQHLRNTLNPRKTNIASLLGLTSSVL